MFFIYHKGLLFLQANKFSKNLPSTFYDLTRLEVAYLRRNSFTGTIGNEISNLTKLTQFLVDGNQFNGTIPSPIGNLCKFYVSLNLLIMYVEQLLISFFSTMQTLHTFILIILRGNSHVPRSISTHLKYSVQIALHQLRFNVNAAFFVARREHASTSSTTENESPFQTFRINIIQNLKYVRIVPYGGLSLFNLFVQYIF